MAFFQFNNEGSDSALSGAVVLNNSGTNDFFVFNGSKSAVNVVLNITASGAAIFRDPDVYDNNRRVDHQVAASAERSNSNKTLTIRGIQPNATYWSTYTGAASSSILNTSSATTAHGTSVDANERVYVVINT